MKTHIIHFLGVLITIAGGACTLSLIASLLSVIFGFGITTVTLTIAATAAGILVICLIIGWLIIKAGNKQKKQ